MILDDRHIRFLREVAEGRIGPSEDIPLAAECQMLGLTHLIAHGKSSVLVALTPRGKTVLDEEDEAWGED